MVRLLADESIHGDVIRGALRRQPTLDLVRVQDVGLAGADDPTILEWAAAEGRIMLTSDVATLVGYAYARVRSGNVMPGLWVIRQGADLGHAVEDVLIIAECSREGEWEGQVRYLPL
jgi:hypothetical protein